MPYLSKEDKSEADRRYYLKNKAKRLEYSRKYKAENKEKVSIKQAEYYQENKVHIKKYRDNQREQCTNGYVKHLISKRKKEFTIQLDKNNLSQYVNLRTNLLKLKRLINEQEQNSIS